MTKPTGVQLGALRYRAWKGDQAAKDKLAELKQPPAHENNPISAAAKPATVEFNEAR